MVEVNTNPLVRSQPKQHFVFALTLLFAAGLTEWVLRDILPGSTFLFFFPTVLICSVLFGGLPGILVAALAVLFSWFALINPIHSFEVSSTDETMQLISYAFISVLIAWVGGRLKESERERLETRKQTSHDLESKSRYLADMSHEIRTPLGTILGFSELLMDNQVSLDERTQYADTIRRNTHRLASLMDDIFHLAEIEARKIQIERATLNPSEMVEEAIEISKRRADSGDVLIKRADKEKLPAKVYGDKARIKQLLSSLFDSMAGLVRHGEVLVSVTGDHSDSDHAKIVFKISGRTKNGVSFDAINITPQQEKQLTTPFASDIAGQPRAPGTGLGLLLAQQIARAMQGRVHLVNDRDLGSSFVVELPLEIATETPRAEVAANDFDFSNKKILIAEDNIDNRVLVERILAKTGAGLGFAENGLEALELAMREPFDMVLMDIQMPVMDGLESTKSLRERGFNKPILALTANALKEDRERCMAAGCDDYLTKPVQTTLLLSTMGMYFQEAQKRA